jgi:DNA primase
MSQCAALQRVSDFYTFRLVRIPPEKIDEIRNSTDIVDLIGSFVGLKKRGKNYVGLCPFHVEKTPSFNVSPERQMYHCFGCGVGGNVFTFMMEYEKVSFVEAVRTLAEKAGISLPQGTPEQDQIASEQEELYQVCREAGRFFYQSLTETPEGKFALEYFRQRGFSDETIRTFGLGYSPNSWDAFLKYAVERKFTPTVVEKAGLARHREDGTYYDYFRGRAMFPIFSAAGRVIGFGARKLREDDTLGKYLNSPETLIYNKSRVLYGISQAREELREKDSAVLVEGYADLITVFQAGIRNVVASSGTALTREQIQLIGRYTKNVVLVYDGDPAGTKAGVRGVDVILENDLDVRVVVLPEGEDPDSYVRKKGGDAFRSLVEGAVSFVEFIAGLHIQDASKPETPEAQTRLVRGIVQSIAKIRDELKRNFYLKQVAERYRLYESTLHRELEKLLDEGRRYQGEEAAQRIPLVKQEIVDLPRHAGDIPAAERDLIHALLEGGGEVVQFVADNIHFDDITHPRSKALLAFLLDRLEGGTPVEVSTLIDELSDTSDRELIAEVMFSKYQLSHGWGEAGVHLEKVNSMKVAADVLFVLRRRGLEKRLEENQRLLKEATQRGENVIPILERHQRLIEEVKQLELKKEG